MMIPTDLDMRVLYDEKMREAKAVGRINEARRLAGPPPARGSAAGRGRGPLPLGWLLRSVFRAGAV